MRKICTGLLAAALTLGLLAVEPAQAKVYKMAPEERTAALKEKKAKGAKAKKSGQAVPGQDQGGWVEVKPGEKVAKKNRRSKVDDIAQAAEQKGKKSKKSKKEAVETPAKSGKSSKGDTAAVDKKSKKSAAITSDAIVVEKKGHKAAADKAEDKTEPKPGKKSDKKTDKKADKKTDKKADKKAELKADKKAGRKSVSRGDRVVGNDYSGERKVSASSTEVRRTGGSGDDLSGYSVSRPGQAPAPAIVPEVRQEVQPGPVDSAKPVGTEHKAVEGRF